MRPTAADDRYLGLENGTPYSWVDRKDVVSPGTLCGLDILNVRDGKIAAKLAYATGGYR